MHSNLFADSLFFLIGIFNNREIATYENNVNFFFLTIVEIINFVKSNFINTSIYNLYEANILYNDNKIIIYNLLTRSEYAYAYFKLLSSEGIHHTYKFISISIVYIQLRNV